MSTRMSIEQARAKQEQSKAYWKRIEALPLDADPEIATRLATLAHPYHPTESRGKSIRLDFGSDPNYIWIGDQFGHITVIKADTLKYWLMMEQERPGYIRFMATGVDEYAESERRHQEQLARTKAQQAKDRYDGPGKGKAQLNLEDLDL